MGLEKSVLESKKSRRKQRAEGLSDAAEGTVGLVLDNDNGKKSFGYGSKIAKGLLKFVKGYGLVDTDLVDEIVLKIQMGETSVAEVTQLRRNLVKTPLKFSVEIASIDRALSRVSSSAT